MIKINNYNLVKISRDNISLSSWKDWVGKVAEIITNFCNESATMFTTGTDISDSIAHDFGVVKRGKFNGSQYLISHVDAITFDMVSQLVNSDEFYLGHVILISGILSDNDIHNLIIFWEKEIIKSGIEFFKMDTDGNCLNWYNPKIVNEAELTSIQYGIQH